ncbi:MAG: Na+/H+ antiporter NhaA [Actinobacteria bacterium]|nr:Na+/H+ antiporter NhaA [Actinomycetota bacterium]
MKKFQKRNENNSSQSTKLNRISPLADFFKQESASGKLIVLASLVGLLIANSPWGKSYFQILESTFSLSLSAFNFEMDLLHFVNDGLMTIFFFVVGLEIKRELVEGHLSTLKNAALPFFAAIGGMLVPALIYLSIAGDSYSSGWAIPVATDIALAVGVLGLIGSKSISILRPFLLGLAVIDDIGAILIIAVFFSVGVNFSWLLAAGVLVLIVVLTKYLDIRFTTVYIFLGLILWLCLYKSGVHPTMAGVILGLLAPAIPFISKEYVDTEETEELVNLSSVDHVAKTKKIAKNSVSVVEWLLHQIHPWTAFLIVPLFAFANSGIVISAQSLQEALNSPLAWAIFAGLVAGKPLGILAFSFVAIKTSVGALSGTVKWREIFATGSSAGIGFTVSIFIAKLAFTDPNLQNLAILSVLVASVFSGVLSLLLFKLGTSQK